MAPVLGVLAHVVHYTLVLGGAVVVVVLLASARPGRARPAVTPHDKRVEELRVAVASGDLALAPAPAAVSTPPGHLAAPRDVAPGSTAVVVAIVSSAAAAGVHAAAGPVHFRVGLLVGGFFVVSALAQLAWSMLMLLRGPDRTLLWTGLVGNAAIIALWAADPDSRSAVRDGAGPRGCRARRAAGTSLRPRGSWSSWAAAPWSCPGPVR